MDYKTALNILGLPSSYSEKDLLNAYRKKAKEYHPDLNGGMDDIKRQKLEENMKEINIAHSILKLALFNKKEENIKEEDFDTYKNHLLISIKVDMDTDLKSSSKISSNSTSLQLLKKYLKEEYNINQEYYEKIENCRNKEEINFEESRYKRIKKVFCKDYYSDCLNSLEEENYELLEKDEYLKLLDKCLNDAWDVYDFNTLELSSALKTYREMERKFYRMLLNIKVNFITSKIIDGFGANTVHSIINAKKDYFIENLLDEYENQSYKFISDRELTSTLISMITKYFFTNLVSNIKRSLKIKNLKEYASNLDVNIEYSDEELYNMSEKEFEEYLNIVFNLNKNIKQK